MRRGGLVLGLLIWRAAGVTAAEVTVRSEVDARRVGTDDQVELTITVEGSGAVNVKASKDIVMKGSKILQN